MESLIESFLSSSDQDDSISLLEQFCEHNALTFTFTHIDCSARNTFIRRLIDELRNEEENHNRLLFLAKCLEALRLLSRDHSNLADMTTEDSCLVFLKLAGLFSTVQDCRELNMDATAVVENVLVVVEALKCICNLVYQDRVFRRLSIKYNCSEAVCLRLMWNFLPRDVRFFDLRLLFVLTALEPNERTAALHSKAVESLTAALNDLVTDTQLRNTLMLQQLEVKQSSAESSLPARCSLAEVSLEKDEIELLGEILKVIFNVTITISQEDPDEAILKSSYTLVCILRHLLVKCQQLSEEPKGLQNNIINTLINLPYQSYELLYWEIPKKQAKEITKEYKANHRANEHPVVFETFNVEAIHILLGILDQRLIENTSLKESLTPLLSVLTSVAKRNRIIRKYLRQEVLPPLGYVGTEKPEEERTTRGRLVCHLTSADHEVKESVADFLFVLCKESVSRLIKYTGYGNAAGFLADHGLMAGNKDDMSGEYSTDDEDSDTEEYGRIRDQIDPMTGAQRDESVENPLDKMTTEEKEQEAEKLAELFSKLNEKGLVKAAGIGPDGKPKEISGDENM